MLRFLLVADDLGVLDLLLKLENATFDECLFVLCFFVLRVFGEVSVGDSFFETLCNFCAACDLEVFQFIFELLQTFLGDQGLFVIVCEAGGTSRAITVATNIVEQDVVRHAEKGRSATYCIEGEKRCKGQKPLSGAPF